MIVEMARKYELKRRAERQAETRRRIVDAAIELHRTKGPARTTLSDVARLAGVQRHTLYRHFADERELSLACSGLYLETNRPPDPGGWRGIADPAERLRHGLEALYAWYDQVEDMLTRVVRDAEFHPLTAEMFELRSGADFVAIRETLADGLGETAATQAALDLALDFRTWRRLAASGLSGSEAAELMTRSVGAQ
jgi:AcrR family transcriptional regulator